MGPSRQSQAMQEPGNVQILPAEDLFSGGETAVSSTAWRCRRMGKVSLAQINPSGMSLRKDPLLRQNRLSSFGKTIAARKITAVKRKGSRPSSQRKWQRAIFPETPAAFRKPRVGKQHSLRPPMKNSARATAPQAVAQLAQYRELAAPRRRQPAAMNFILPKGLAVSPKGVNHAVPGVIPAKRSLRAAKAAARTTAAAPGEGALK